jgi:aromatic-L-amino-acid decarboxylase
MYQQIAEPTQNHPGYTGDMDPAEFRRYGHEVVDWIATYLAGAASYPVMARTAPGAISCALPTRPPAEPEPMGTILTDFERIVLPGITHWNAPGFLAYFGTTGSAPGILGELLTAALNVNAMLWSTCPAATELEQITLDWLRQMLGLPAPLFGVLHETSSSGVVYALAAAREALVDLHVREQGLAGRADVPRLRYYASQEAHVSVEKAGMVLGVGQQGLRKIGVDSAYRMDVAALELAIQEDLAAGWRPFAVVATVGTTSTTSVDPVAEIAAICHRYGLWLHVDAAYGGSAAIDLPMRWVLDGCEHADTLTINPHKWLFVPFPCSVFYTRKPELVRAAFSLVPEYLRTRQDGSEEVPNFMEYSTSLTHPFRALKLWMVLRYFGHQGLAARIREHIRLGHLLAEWIDGSEEFERVAPTPFSTVCFRAHLPYLHDEVQLDALNERLLNEINNAGRYFLSHTRVRGKYTLRLAVGNLRTNEQVVRKVWSALQEALVLVRSEPGAAVEADG